jgi:hypothetical protein
MKSKLDQIEFIDTTLLPIFNVNGVNDYLAKINILNKNDNIVSKLNNMLDTIKNLFPVKNFNLHKTQNKILNFEQSISVLRNCLIIAGIQFEIIKNKKEHYMRLVNENKILKHYIENIKMSDGRTFETIDEYSYKPFNDSKENRIYIDDLNNNIKSTMTEEYYMLCSKNHDNKSFTFGSTTIPYLKKNIKSIEIDFSHANESSEKYITYELIKLLFSQSTYEIHLGGHIIYSNSLKLNKNLLPDNLILPLEYAEYSALEIKVIYSSEIAKLIDDLKIKIKFQHCTYSKQFHERLQKNFIDLQINNIVYWIYGGCFDTKYINKLEQSLPIYNHDFIAVVSKLNNNINNNIVTKQAKHYETYGNYNLLKVNCEHVTDCLRGLVENDNIDITFMELYETVKFKYHYEANNQLVMEFVIPRVYDTLNNFVIKFGYNVSKYIEPVFSIVKYGPIDEVETFKMNKINNYTYQILDLTENYHFNICGMNTCSYLFRIVFNIDNSYTEIINSLYNHTKIQYSGYLYDVPLRCQLSKSNKIIFNYDDFTK